jgi:hypothetical protein
MQLFVICGNYLNKSNLNYFVKKNIAIMIEKIRWMAIDFIIDKYIFC